MPYRRGFIYALYLDNQIRLATAGKHSLRDVLLRLFDQAKKRKATKSEATLKVKDFVDAVAVYLPRQQVEREIQENMIAGKPLDFHTIKLVDGFSVGYEGEVPVLRLYPTVDLVKFYER